MFPFVLVLSTLVGTTAEGLPLIYKLFSHLDLNEGVGVTSEQTRCAKLNGSDNPLLALFGSLKNVILFPTSPFGTFHHPTHALLIFVGLLKLFFIKDSTPVIVINGQAKVLSNVALISTEEPRGTFDAHQRFTVFDDIKRRYKSATNSSDYLKRVGFVRPSFNFSAHLLFSTHAFYLIFVR